MLKATETDKAYIAGFVDGEGYIGVVRTGDNASRLEVSVGQLNPFPLKFIHERFGGWFQQLKPNHKSPIYRWRIAGDKAAEFLIEIEMHLIVKKEQAKLAIEYQCSKGGKGKRPSKFAAEKESEFSTNIKQLNAQYKGNHHGRQS